jgi:hypothetical protein
MTQDQIEDFAFYESGLSADGCLEKIDDYAKEAIKRYGRIVSDKLKNQRFIGILDNNLKPIHENDVVKFVVNNEEKIGQVIYSKDSAAFCLDVHPIITLDMEKFEVIGNMENDYHYNEFGELALKPK